MNATKVREYPRSNDSVEYDLPNQIVHDLRGTFGHRAVALEHDDGTIIEWYAHHKQHNRVVEWWPNFLDEPVWNAYSIYAFSTGLRYYDEARFVMYDWPEELDRDAEVLL